MATIASTAVLGERRAGRSRTESPFLPGLAVFGLRCGEAAAIALAGALAWWLHPAREAIGLHPVAAIALACLFAGWLAGLLGAYDLRYVFAARAGLRRQLAAWACTMAALLLAASLLRVSGEYARLWAAMWFTSGTALIVGMRVAFVGLTGSWIREGRFAQRTVVVGTTDHGQRFARHLLGCPDICTRIIGFVHDDADPGGISHVGRHPILGNIAYLVHMIRRNEVDQVVIALPWSERERIMRLLAELADTPVDIRLAPELLRFEFLQRRVEMVGGIPMLRVLDRPVSGSAALVKTAEDLILGSLLLLAFAPVMLAVALAIKLDSPGPVFFRQTRSGFNNKLIKVWKFRTMYHHLSDASASALTLRDDPRVTRLGHFLRRSSLDELPQLLNVVCGEMSLVGPRPHALQAKAGDQLYQDVMVHYAARHRVKPGLTGWAQVNGWRGETDTSDKLLRRVEHDLHYIEHWSLWLDLRILLRTVWVVIGGRNAF